MSEHKINFSIISQAQAALSILILITVQAFAQPSSLMLISPNGGQWLFTGELYDITWEASTAIVNVKLEYSHDRGVSWQTIVVSAPNDGVFSWTVPDAVTNTALIRVSDAADINQADVSDHPFFITYRALVEFTPTENNPVLEPTPGGWDENIRERGWFIYADGMYHAWYGGWEGAYDHGVPDLVKLGYAYSTDGVHWTKHATNPVSDQIWTEDVAVVKDGDTYYLYAEDEYSADGGGVNVDLYISTDRVNWTRHGTVLSRASEGWDARHVGTQTVWKEEAMWYMLYEGFGNDTQGQVGLATSSDGKNWSRYAGNPVVTHPDGPNFDIAIDSIIKINNVYYAYGHYRAADRSWDGGMFTSIDLVSWTAYAGNPLPYNSPVIVDNGTHYYLYSINSKTTGVGSYNLAISPHPPTTTLPDDIAPNITQVTTKNVTNKTATVVWRTNELATSQVEYGLTTGYGSSSPLSSVLVTSHSVGLSGLTAGATYHYRVKSKDAAGNLAVSHDFTFTTATTAANVSARIEVDPYSEWEEFTCRVFNQSETARITSVTLTGAEPTTFDIFLNGSLFSVSPALGGNNDDNHAAEVTLHFSGLGLAAGTSDNNGQGNDLDWRTRSLQATVHFDDGNVAIGSFTNQQDNDDGNTALWVAEVSVQNADTQSPIISNVTSGNLTPASVTITWNTNEASDSQVEYGLTAGYGSSSPLSGALVTSHSVGLSGLSAGSTYHYRVKSKDVAGNLAVSNDFTFTTWLTANKDSLKSYVLVSDKIINFNHFTMVEGEVFSNRDATFLGGKPSIIQGNLTAFRNVSMAAANRITGDLVAGGMIMKDTNATVTGTVVSGATVDKIALPTFAWGPFDGPEIAIASGDSAYISPGDYQLMRAYDSAIMKLSSGRYNVNRFVLDGSTKLRLDLSGGPIEINVVSRLLFRPNARIIITSAIGSSEDISINYKGLDKVEISKDTELQGTLTAPEARVKLGSRASFLGSICANRVDVYFNSHVRHHSVPGGIPKITASAKEDEVVTEQLTATSYELTQNSPNPFNSNTAINFTLPEAGEVTLQIYNTVGQLVKQLASGHFTSGGHKVRWEGRNSAGEQVAAGIYLYRLIVHDATGAVVFTETKSMALLK